MNATGTGWNQEYAETFLQNLGDVPRSHISKMFGDMMVEDKFSATLLLKSPTTESVGFIAGQAPFYHEGDTTLSTAEGWKKLASALDQIQNANFDLSLPNRQRLTHWQYLAVNAYEFHSNQDAAAHVADEKTQKQYTYEARRALAKQLSRDCTLHAYSLQDSTSRATELQVAQHAAGYWSVQSNLHDFYSHAIQNPNLALTRYDERGILAQLNGPDKKFVDLRTERERALTNQYKAYPQYAGLAELPKNVTDWIHPTAHNEALAQLTDSEKARAKEFGEKLHPLLTTLNDHLESINGIRLEQEAQKAAAQRAQSLAVEPIEPIPSIAPAPTSGRHVTPVFDKPGLTVIEGGDAQLHTPPPPSSHVKKVADHAPDSARRRPHKIYVG